MKDRTGLFLLLLLWPALFWAQNAAPVVSNVTVNHVPASQSVTFTFDVTDLENDPVDVQLRISGDNGRTWLVQLDSIVGDTGYPTIPGTGRTIVWVYNPTALASAFPSGSRDFIARIVADDRVPVDIQSIVNQVDSTRLVEDLLFVEGIRHRTGNPAHLAAVRDSLRDLMAAANLQDWHHTWNFQGYTGENYGGRLSGLTEEAKTWLISGHYDSVSNSPGADDNGTATAALMEAVRVLAAYHFQNSMRFLAFDLEEDGLRGSREYVTNHIEDWEQVGGLLNMEMIGYKDETVNTQSLPVGFNLLFPAAFQTVQADSFRGNFLTNVANTASEPLRAAFDSCAAAYVPDLRVISIAVPGTGTIAPDLRRSDHAPFWDAGYQALMLTDAADLRNPFYHSPADTVGTLDLAFYFQNVKAIVATLAKLAQPMHAGTAISGPVSILVPVGLAAPEAMEALRIYPNPTSGALHFELNLAAPGRGHLAILDAQGKQVATVSAQYWSAGHHRLAWQQAGQLPAGNYWVVLRQNERQVTRPLRILE